MKIRSLFLGVMVAFISTLYSQNAPYDLPIKDSTFKQQIHHPYTTEQNLPDNRVNRIFIDRQNRVVAETAAGPAFFDGQTWQSLPESPQTTDTPQLDAIQLAALYRAASEEPDIRDVAEHQGEFAVAAHNGLWLGDGNTWRLALPQQGKKRWAPVDVRAVAYDTGGRLWFASPQGVGCRTLDGKWSLYTGADGLPYNDFTCIATGPNSIWFGTTNGAIRYADGEWSFRQGRRWLLDNHINDITVDGQGNAWIATAKGVSCLAFRDMTLAKKAAFYESEIEKYHLRTRLGYVNQARLAVPGDKSTAVAFNSENGGHSNGLYLGAVSLGYAATGNPKFKQDAKRAFRALAFLSEVTQGGSHPAPKGFIARSVRPTSGPDPNPERGREYNLRRNQSDTLWKLIEPRWPVDETGEWYWYNDSSSDELDGHFFGYAIYFDRVCSTRAEKAEVETVVRSVMDHIIENDYTQVDHDGLPTRWGHFSPDDLNRNPAWVVERGLNSYSILTYLAITYHITGDPKYRQEYMRLALDQGYGMNGMTQPRDISGPGSHGQPDDMMAFMNYYHLIRYETDPRLLSMYTHAIRRHWQIERYERHSFENFVYAACCMNKVRTDQWGETVLTPPKENILESIETLKRYPLDLIDWPMSHAHRIDMVPLQDHLGHSPGAAGHGLDDYVFPMDEGHEIYWDRDFYELTNHQNGTVLRYGFHYMLAYYMGLVHGFISE
jgi:hypothetical protein